MNVPCPVHGSKRAHRGCHRCRQPICSLCELKLRGHLYCSTRCAGDAGRAEMRSRFRRRLGRPVSPRLAVLSVLLACSAPAVLAVRTVAQLDRLNAPSRFSPVRRPPLARVERVTAEADGARIEGTAPSGAAVFLFAGGHFTATTVAGDGRFRFERVQSPGPYRVGALPLAAPAAEEGSSAGFPPVPVPAMPPASPLPMSDSAAPEHAALTRDPPLPAPGRTEPAPDGGTPPRDDVVPERVSATPSPPVPRAAAPRLASVPDLSRGPRDRREVLLSFDAGSSDRGSREILDALRAHGIRTTIFLTGEFIRRYPELVRRIVADGHEVGNHTESHPHLTTYARDGRQATRAGVDRAFVAGELSRTERLFREATGGTLAPFWRAPFGEQNEEVRRWAAESGYWHVGWTGGRAGLDGLDWISDPCSRGYRSSRRVVEALVERAENGGIVLLHLADSGSRARPSFSPGRV
ncbi:MAG: polysaccharide deacetylase family protein [Acidobacteria bacterium]|nr:polysaccharide deacetylase family protein [Acidobacteriota bacterium]